MHQLKQVALFFDFYRLRIEQASNLALEQSLVAHSIIVIVDYFKAAVLFLLGVGRLRRVLVLLVEDLQDLSLRVLRSDPLILLRLLLVSSTDSICHVVVLNYESHVLRLLLDFRRP